MCGRTRSSLAPEQVVAAAGVPHDRWIAREQYRAANNVQPGQPLVVLHAYDGQPTLQTMLWGLVPSYHEKSAPLNFFHMFNARSESAHIKSFKRLLASRRCAVLTNGFYEWKGEAGGAKQPYLISWGDDSPMWMAGLFDVYECAEGVQLYTCTVLTVDSAQRLAWLHHRMPALLRTHADVAAWVGGNKDGANHDARFAAAVEMLHTTIRPYPGEDLTWWPVTKAMSRAAYNAPDAAQDIRTKRGTITAFFKPQARPGQEQQQQQVKASTSGEDSQDTKAVMQAGVEVEAPAAGVAGVRTEEAGAAAAKAQAEGQVRNPDEVGCAPKAEEKCSGGEGEGAARAGAKAEAAGVGAEAAGAKAEDAGDVRAEAAAAGAGAGAIAVNDKVDSSAKSPRQRRRAPACVPAPTVAGKRQKR